MAMSVRYTTVDGQVLCESRGGVKTLFMPDTLGNVIETRNMDTGAQTSSTTYWPYGEVRTQTGTNPSPFGFCGVWGFYTQAGQSTYVRARYYRPNLGRWQTVDPLWPDELPYAYASLAPTRFVDPTGTLPSIFPPTTWPCAVTKGLILRESFKRFGSEGDHMVHCYFYCTVKRFTLCIVNAYASEFVQLLMNLCRRLGKYDAPPWLAIVIPGGPASMLPLHLCKWYRSRFIK
jgi:RHS repeat-associated protein